MSEKGQKMPQVPTIFLLGVTFLAYVCASCCEIAKGHTTSEFALLEASMSHTSVTSWVSVHAAARPFGVTELLSCCFQATGYQRNYIDLKFKR